MSKILPIYGAIQHYAWGGFQFLPELLQIDNKEHLPFAELWMGTHDRGPAKLSKGNQTQLLQDWLNQNPTALGSKIQQQFQGKLPFLFKVLDVRQMLSIQSHPTKSQAEIGFRKENEQGISLDASFRNFKDDNHKPEIMVALTPFWLLHGFKSEEAIEAVLEAVPEFHPLKPYFRAGNIATFYEHLMKMPQASVNKLLTPLYQRLHEKVASVEADKYHADYWALRAFRENSLPDGGHDRGIFSIYLFNLVYLNVGESIFQAAGVPHAYLEGVNMELMANSDNVFRGGLTPKHIDVAALMNHLVFEPVTPDIQKGKQLSATEKVFKTPAPDFELSRIDLETNQSHLEPGQDAPQILITMAGEAHFDQGLVLKRGQICFVPANQAYLVKGQGKTLVFKATVP